MAATLSLSRSMNVVRLFSIIALLFIVHDQEASFRCLHAFGVQRYAIYNRNERK